MENYRNLGWFEDANNCYYYQRKALREHVPLTFLIYFFYLAADVSYGYGVKPEFALRNSVIIIIFFGLMFFSARRPGLSRKLSNEAIIHAPIIHTPIIHTPITKHKIKFKNRIVGSLRNLLNSIKIVKASLSISAIVFLSGTKFFVDPPKVTDIPGGTNPWIRRLSILERALGAVFQGLFALAVAKTVLNI